MPKPASSFTMPIQQKIAELERRIEVLESAWKRRTVRTTTTEVGPDLSPLQRWHWDQVWKHFDKLFRGVMR